MKGGLVIWMTKKADGIGDGIPKQRNLNLPCPRNPYGRMPSEGGSLSLNLNYFYHGRSNTFIHWSLFWSNIR
jgi:hypothetical protein